MLCAQVFSSNIMLAACGLVLIIYAVQMSFINYDVRSLKEAMLRSMPTKLKHVDEYPEVLYKRYLEYYKKNYSSSEKKRRFKIFKASLKDLPRLNQDPGATYGLTKFSDMPHHKVFNYRRHALRDCAGLSRDCTTQCEHFSEFNCVDYPQNKTIPLKFDWRDHGKVGPVLDQKLCNGCWAFGIAGVMESMAAIQDSTSIVNLSIQQLLDCALDPYEGCNYGNVNTALSNICRKQVDVVSEEVYPLRLVMESCPNNIPYGSYSKRLKRYCQLCFIADEENILRLVAHHGPVVAIVNAGPWVNYIDGVIQRSCYRSKDGASKDHVVQIVGYDKTGPIPHYIIRNSWGEDFGAGGYVKLALYGDVCGISEEIYYLNVY